MGISGATSSQIKLFPKFKNKSASQFIQGIKIYTFLCFSVRMNCVRILKDLFLEAKTFFIKRERFEINQTF